jgi:hypothetical protein
METKIEHWPLLSFKEYEKDINPNPNYQRGSVWRPKQKQMLIDSILRKIDIPKIYLRENKRDGFSYEIIDGQQRMKTIWDFLIRDFRLSEETDDLLIDGEKYNVAGLSYKELGSKVKIERVHKYTLDVVIITNASENEIADLFFRLNNGTPLSPAEVRNSMPGKMTETIREIAFNNNFFKKVSFSSNRFAYHQVCAQMMMLELNNGLSDTRDRFLSKMYSDYKNSIPKYAIDFLKRTQRIVNDLFPDKSRLLNRASTINIYLLISYLLKTTKLSDKFYDNFLEWYQYTEPERRKNDEYKLYMSSSANSRRSIENRFRILILDFYKVFKEMEIIELDSKRNFDDNQKAEIYARDKGICQICSKKVSEYNWHADHITPWIKGGKTIIENGQVLCVKDNLRKSNKLW